MLLTPNQPLDVPGVFDDDQRAQPGDGDELPCRLVEDDQADRHERDGDDRSRSRTLGGGKTEQQLPATDAEEEPARPVWLAVAQRHPELLDRPVTMLSVGQQQRVAAARALMGGPELLIADEPTSSLDADRRESFVRLLFDECRQAGSTLVFVSHDEALMRRLCDRCLLLDRGAFVMEGTPDAVYERCWGDVLRGLELQSKYGVEALYRAVEAFNEIPVDRELRKLIREMATDNGLGRPAGPRRTAQAGLRDLRGQQLHLDENSRRQV